MNGTAVLRALSLTVLASVLGACASTGTLLESPQVSLRNVQVTALDLSSQTFLLDFDVTNPNPFPLPISAVSYGVELDGFRFASGKTHGAFTVPASSDGGFAISVDVDLMRTAPQLLFIVREGVYREIPYALNGRFEVDIPLAPPVTFKTEGMIRLQASAVSADREQ